MVMDVICTDNGWGSKTMGSRALRNVLFAILNIDPLLLEPLDTSDRMDHFNALCSPVSAFWVSVYLNSYHGRGVSPYIGLCQV